MSLVEASSVRSLAEIERFTQFLGGRIGRSLDDQAQFPVSEASTIGDLHLDSLEVIQVLVTLEMINSGFDLGVQSLTEALDIEVGAVIDAVFGVGAPLPDFVQYRS